MIVAHGSLAKEYLAAMEHVVGPQEAALSIEIASECDRPAKEAEILAAVESVDTGDGVIVVTDLFGGSPCNLSLRGCCGSDRKMLYGANLPMLVQLAKSRDKPLDEALGDSVKAARHYINSFNGPNR